MKFMEVNSVDGTIRMSKIVKGADYFGTTISEDTAFALLDRYFELGGNTIDTARIYGQANPADPDGPTYSEGIVGRWLASRGMRKDVVLVTKGCHQTVAALLRAESASRCSIRSWKPVFPN